MWPFIGLPLLSIGFAFGRSNSRVLVFPAEAGIYSSMGTGLRRCDNKGEAFRYWQGLFVRIASREVVAMAGQKPDNTPLAGNMANIRPASASTRLPRNQK
jgi:hypothetical protein